VAAEFAKRTMTRRAKRWGRGLPPNRIGSSETSFRTLPIRNYEARYGPVGEFQHVEGGTVEFVLERGGQVRFICVKKDSKLYNALRWKE
jgi:hypothetical protein